MKAMHRCFRVLSAVMACLVLGALLLGGCRQHDTGRQPAGPSSPAVTVPDVRAMTPEDAAKTLAQGGLILGQTMNTAESKWADVTKPGLIVAQSATPGARVPRRTVVNVIVYRPVTSEYSEVPELHGLTYAEAAAELKKAGLLVGEVSRRFIADQRLYDVVHRQSPEPGTLVQRWSKVNLGLYGPVQEGLVHVPRLTGLNAAEVPAVLAKVGLQQGEVTTVKAPAMSLVGTVRGQSPSIGTQVKKDTKVDIVVYAEQ